MAFRTQKISQMTPKGANLEGTDLLEVSTLESGSYVTRSITGQEIIDAASGTGVTDITVNAPLATTGGTTPDLSISEADGSTDGYLTAVDWNTFNDKQNALTLTTTGTSGAATLVGDTLNIPQYSGGGGGGGSHTPFKFKTTVLTTGATSAALVGSTLGNFTMGANNIHCYPYIPKYSFTANGLYLNVPVGVAGNLGRILIYQDVDGVPTTKLFESANLDLGTSGIKTAATTFSFVAGTVYWLAFHCNAVPSGSISGIPVASAINFAIQSTSPVTAFTRIVTFGTSSPSPLNPTSANNSVLPFIGITSA